ncbi:hypothetical protein ACS0TY_002850 [Phlomoides rotata]
MADAAVEFLLENIQQLLLYHTSLISNAKEQVEKLDNDLRLFKAFLRDSTNKRREDEGLRELVRQIRDVVYEAEDIIDAFITQAVESSSENYFLRAFLTPAKLLTIAKEVEKIGAKVRGIYGDQGKFNFASLGVGDGNPDEPEEDINIQAENCSAIPAAFKLLRVLDVKPIKLTKIPFGSFETLIIHTTSRTLDIRADIWKLIHLRYLKTNASATLPKATKSSKEGEKLQMLGTISPQNCTEEVFDRARNLKKLGIRGRLSLLLDGETGSFDSLGRLSSLENMKLINDVFPSPPSEGQLRCLPPAYKFPPKLRSLTLVETFLDWSHMSVLGLLPNLEVLKLKDKAFMGKIWVATDGGFRNLEVLEIGRTDLVVWEASVHHFPRLRQLELQNCEELQEVPTGLAEIPSLQLLIVRRCKFAAASAKKIPVARLKKQGEEQTIKFNELKLSIFPPDEWSVYYP